MKKLFGCLVVGCLFLFGVSSLKTKIEVVCDSGSFRPIKYEIKENDIYLTFEDEVVILDKKTCTIREY